MHTQQLLFLFVPGTIFRLNLRALSISEQWLIYTRVINPDSRKSTINFQKRRILKEKIALVKKKVQYNCRQVCIFPFLYADLMFSVLNLQFDCRFFLLKSNTASCVNGLKRVSMGERQPRAIFFFLLLTSCLFGQRGKILCTTAIKADPKLKRG